MSARRRVPACALVLLLVSWCVPCRVAPARAAMAPAALPGRTGALPANVLVASGRTEPALAVDPRDSRRIVAAANPDYYHALPLALQDSAFLSYDGGATWVRSGVPPYRDFTTVADPSLGFGADGHVYYLYMGETPTFCGESGNAALLLARSLDGGRSFGPPTVVDVNPSDDKPFLTVTSTGGHTAIYASFTRWTDPDRQILFTRSLDGGRTFAAPSVLFASRGVNMGSVPVAGPRGHVYVLWAHYHSSNYYGPVQASIMLRASTNGGRTFTPAVTVAAFTGLPEMLVPGSLRVFSFPAAAVDPHSGTLYVVWVQARPMNSPRYAGQMEADLLLSRSRDGGRTWTKPVVLNDTVRGDRFMPALSIGPHGVVQVVFYDRRADGVSLALYGVAAHARGKHWLVWPNRRISAALSSPYLLHYIAPGSTCVAPGRFMGDYIAAATAPNGTLNTMWTDTARGNPGETDLWLASLSPAYLQAGTPRLLRLER